MRDIKFRTWTGSEFLKSSCQYCGSENYNNDNGFIVQQYIGLKDKNGVEIYEGDVLYCPKMEMNIVIRWDITGANWQFDELQFGDDGVGIGNWDFKMYLSRHSEVIGNIYEDAHLLNNK